MRVSGSFGFTRFGTKTSLQWEGCVNWFIGIGGSEPPSPDEQQLPRSSIPVPRLHLADLSQGFLPGVASVKLAKARAARVRIVEKRMLTVLLYPRKKYVFRW